MTRPLDIEEVERLQEMVVDADGLMREATEVISGLEAQVEALLEALQELADEPFVGGIGVISDSKLTAAERAAKALLARHNKIEGSE